jgi:chorismate mutase/prephenate dehydrogenase
MVTSSHRATEESAVSPQNELNAVRGRIRELDGELIALAAERVRLVRRVGEIKRAAGLRLIDYAQERRVLDAAGERAAAAGLAPEVAQDLMARLIRAAVTVQEEESLLHAASGEGRRAVVVGGAGRMGRWMVRFLEAQGWATAELDPAASEAENRRSRAWLPDADLVVCSTPPDATRRLYRGWCEGGQRPRGVLVDLASIKSPLVEPIRELRRAGCRVASIHPMFGPDTPLLRDKEVVLCDTGDDEARALIESLFRPTTAILVHLPLEAHDRVMADVLSLAHATVIAFTLALPAATPAVHSNTYRALLDLAANAVDQNPDVYFQIQASNPHSLPAIARLCEGIEQVRRVVESHDPAAFAALLAEGGRRLQGNARAEARAQGDTA